jgi:hypothetical protein
MLAEGGLADTELGVPHFPTIELAVQAFQARGAGGTATTDPA